MGCCGIAGQFVLRCDVQGDVVRLLLVLFALLFCSVARAAESPNIVMVFIDDMG